MYQNHFPLRTGCYKLDDFFPPNRKQLLSCCILTLWVWSHHPLTALLLLHITDCTTVSDSPLKTRLRTWQCFLKIKCAIFKCCKQLYIQGSSPHATCYPRGSSLEAELAKQLEINTYSLTELRVQVAALGVLPPLLGNRSSLWSLCDGARGIYLLTWKGSFITPLVLWNGEMSQLFFHENKAPKKLYSVAQRFWFPGPLFTMLLGFPRRARSNTWVLSILCAWNPPSVCAWGHACSADRIQPCFTCPTNQVSLM